MASEDGVDDGSSPEGGADGGSVDLQDARRRLEQGADRAVDEFDQGVVDLLAWLLDTETRARIYVYIRQHPDSTSDEVADGTGLYPSTVREALADLHDEGTVTRDKRESGGAGNNPYEYEAIPPSRLVRETVGQVQSQLNAVFELEDRLGGDGPVSITIAGDRDGEDDGDDTDLAGSDDESADGPERAVNGSDR